MARIYWQQLYKGYVLLNMLWSYLHGTRVMCWSYCAWYEGYGLFLTCLEHIYLSVTCMTNMTGEIERGREREGKIMVFGRIFLHANVAIELKDDYKFPNRIVRL